MNNSFALYNQTSFEISRIVTRSYSTSFYLASTFFHAEIRRAIFAIYGFVRFADEIVDTFHHTNKEELLNKFETDLNDALEQKISLNPVLHSFQQVVHQYGISRQHIHAFLTSMRFDLTKQFYSNATDINEYIHGSADVVGLMCLKVFCNGNGQLYNQLEVPAIKLGSAFQKVNFLRDLKNDMEELHRIYFPNIKLNGFSNEVKRIIVADIESDFSEAFNGIVQLPKGSRLAVLIAWYYYHSLLKKIKTTQADTILQKRIRVPDYYKIALIAKACFANRFVLPKAA